MKIFRARPLAVGAGLVAALLLFVLPAGARTSGPPAGWSWPEVAPGTAVSLDADAAALAARGGVEVASVRELARAGSQGFTFRLLMGRNGGGERCVATSSAIVRTSYACLGELIDDGRALVVLPSLGGSSLGVVDRATVLGVTREDVARLTVQTLGGAVRSLPLNRWRAFAYTAGDAAAVPTSLTAYGRGGDVLETYRLDAAPPG